MSIRDNVTSLLLQRGIDYGPVGDDGSWLWCLGGPDLFRLPIKDGNGYEEYADTDSCIDLNVWLCEEHEVMTADLFPYDLVPEFGAATRQDPRQSTPITLDEDAAAAASGFLSRLESWLDEILDLPA